MAFIVVLISVIYSALDPTFGMNLATLAMLISLAIGVGLLSIFYEGTQVILSLRRFGLEGRLELHPLGIVVALVSVIATRLVHMHPGIVLGFVAGAAVSAEDPREEGQITFVPMVGSLALSLVALLLIGPFRGLSNDSVHWWAVIPETVAVTVFVGGIEGLLFGLLPLEFMDGRKVWDWSKVAWAGLAVAATFLFFHVLLNQTDGYASALANASVQGLFILCAVFVVAAGAFWLACRLSFPERGSGGPSEVAGP
jgi:hypothetical protein